MRRRTPERRRPSVSVLRIGHRPGRDPRLTTHLALVARAFGAERLYLEPPDPPLAERIDRVRGIWGGTFEVRGVPRWRPVLEEFPGGVAHLTMYGEPLELALPRLRRRARVLAVVGGAKVPADLYGRADVNVAVGAQPHSEVGALAVFLDRLVGIPGPERWRGARRRIVPQARGKRVIAAETSVQGGA
jgi:tRNA (cytidine56-2'-O)-methyltransferase